jgi:hypothetical protein
MRALKKSHQIIDKIVGFEESLRSCCNIKNEVNS